MTNDNEPQFIIHQDTQMFITDPIHFQLVQMNKSMFIWVGKQQANMKDLSIAMPPTGSQVKTYYYLQNLALSFIIIKNVCFFPSIYLVNSFSDNSIRSGYFRAKS